MKTAGRIFMVNSEHGNVSKYQQALEKHGYEVFSTGNPYKLVKYANELHPQMYVMDLETDNVDGWEVMRYLSDNAYTEDAPVVMINVDEGRSSRPGASHYLGHTSVCYKLLRIADAYIRGNREYKILLLEDYAHQGEGELTEINNMAVSYFKVYDRKAANVFLRKNVPQVIAVHSKKEDYDEICSELGSDKTFYVENQDNIKDLIAILH